MNRVIKVNIVIEFIAVFSHMEQYRIYSNKRHLLVMQHLRYEKFHKHSCTNLGKYGMHFKLKIPYLLSPKGAYLFSSLLILTSDEITCYI